MESFTNDHLPKSANIGTVGHIVPLPDHLFNDGLMPDMMVNPQSVKIKR